MNVLGLFSGIGGFELGLKRVGFNIIAMCEIDKFCQKVLKKHWPDVLIHEDITKLDGKQYAGTIDLICGGFPCQDISIGGKGKGLSGERSSLWFSMLETIGLVRPKYVIVENVDALRKRGLSEILTGLAKIGYNAEWHSIPASRVGSLHKRERLWIICYLNSGNANYAATLQLYNTQKWQTQEGVEEWQYMLHELGAGDIAQRFDTYAGARRILDAIPNRLDRTKALGNTVVPIIPEIIGKCIMQIETQQREEGR